MITDDRPRSDLARVDALHTGLTQIVLEGGDLAGIADEVARALDAGVLFTSTDGRERAAALPDDLRQRLAVADLVDPTGRFRVERVDASGAGRRRPGAHPPRRRGGHRPGPAGLRQRRGPVLGDRVQAMERASAVAALLMTREQAVAAVENKYQGDFLRDLFLRRAGDEQYVVEHADDLRLGPAPPGRGRGRRARPGACAAEPSPSAQRRQWQERFSAAWRQVTRDVDPDIPSVDFSSEVVTLLPVVDG